MNPLATANDIYHKSEDGFGLDARKRIDITAGYSNAGDVWR